MYIYCTWQQFVNQLPTTKILSTNVVIDLDIISYMCIIVKSHNLYIMNSQILTFVRIWYTQYNYENLMYMYMYIALDSICNLSLCRSRRVQ